MPAVSTTLTNVRKWKFRKSSRMLSIAIICVKIGTCCPFCFQLPKQDSQSLPGCEWEPEGSAGHTHNWRQPLHTGVTSGRCLIPESRCTISVPRDWTAGVSFHGSMPKKDLLHTNTEEQLLQLGTHTGLYKTNQNFFILIFNCSGY